MWSNLYLHRFITLAKHLDVPPERVLEFLHDPPSLIMRSPVAVSFKELPSNCSIPSTELINPNTSPESKYTITDLVPMFFGLFNVRTTVTATFTQNPDGACMSVGAVAGTRLNTTWTVKEDAVRMPIGGGCERASLLTEVVEITVSAYILYLGNR